MGRGIVQGVSEGEMSYTRQATAGHCRRLAGYGQREISNKSWYLGSGHWSNVFTCVSYAEARNRYRLDVRPSVRLSVRPIRHTLAPYQNG